MTTNDAVPEYSSSLPEPKADKPARRKQKLTPRALLEIKRLSDPQIHPDGQRVAFVVTEADFDESRFASHLWLTEWIAPAADDVGEQPEEQAAVPDTSESGNGTGGSNAVVEPEANPGSVDAAEANDSAEEDTDPTRQLTFSRDGESHPRWSPDGRYLAFLSAREDESEPIPDEDDEDAPREQVWILPTDGGEARKLTSAKEGVLEYDWVPDTNTILFLASEPRPRPLESLRKDERERRKIDPVVEQEDKLRRQFWRVDVEERKPKLLFTADYGVSDFAISPDGERLCYATNYTGEWNDYHHVDLYVRHLSDGRNYKLLARAGGKYHLRWSPAGQQIAFLAWFDPEISYSRESLFVCGLPVDPPEEAIGRYGAQEPGITEARLFCDLDTDLHGFEWARSEGQEHVRGFALAATKTHSELFAVHSYTNPEPVDLGASAERYDLAIDPRADALAWVQETGTAPPEIFLRDEQGQIHQLTRLNADFPDSYYLPEQRVVTWTSPDGLEIEGVLTLPVEENGVQVFGYSGVQANSTSEAYGPPIQDIESDIQQERQSSEASFPEHLNTRTPEHPLVVQIHGGPKGRSTNTLQNYSMAPVWATEGYAVLRPNFRGSEGYGNAFAVANRRDLGGGDFADIMAGVDWCVAQGIANPQRLGVMGGSYGGYMTNWAIGHTDKFKAAISMFGIFHLQTDYSNSELSRWDNDYLGAYYWEDPEIYRRLSPGSYIESIKTPTLILHGDEDNNTFISNSKELYQALRHRGVTTQFVHYPREGHGLREPNHKLDEIRRCLAWMDKYVRHDGENPGVYRMGDKVPSANGSLELRVTRAEIANFLGQAKPNGSKRPSANAAVTTTTADNAAGTVQAKRTQLRCWK